MNLKKKRIRDYAAIYYDKQKRKGINLDEAYKAIRSRAYYGAMMVETGDADAMIGGLSRRFPETIRPALKVVGPKHGVKKVAGMHIVMTKSGPLFLSDTTINHELNAEDIAGIAELTHAAIRSFEIEPKMALVTYSNFGTAREGEAAKLMNTATSILHERHPDWILDGEMQAHLALEPETLNKFYPFSKLNGHKANALIFPNLSSANIAYNLVGSISNLDIIGPVLLGLNKSIHVLQMGASIRQIVDMVGIAAIQAQDNAKHKVE